jgi:hypothetical protein
MNNLTSTPLKQNNYHSNPVFNSPSSQNDWSTLTNSSILGSVRSSRQEKMNKHYLNLPLNNQEDCSEELLFINLWSKLYTIHEKRNNINIEKEFNIKPHFYATCPFCKETVIAESNKVQCYNECINFDIYTCKFNPLFTVNDLISNYVTAKKEHELCNSCLIWIEYENEITFVCEKCLDN